MEDENCLSFGNETLKSKNSSLLWSFRSKAIRLMSLFLSLSSLTRHWSLSLTLWFARLLSPTSSLSSCVELASPKTTPWAAPLSVAAWWDAHGHTRRCRSSNIFGASTGFCFFHLLLDHRRSGPITLRGRALVHSHPQRVVLWGHNRTYWGEWTGPQHGL